MVHGERNAVPHPRPQAATEGEFHGERGGGLSPLSQIPFAGGADRRPV